MKILLCLTGTTEIIPSVENSKTIKGDLNYISSLLYENIHNNKQVIIVGAGDKASHAASLAMKFEKKCFINGEEFEFRKNALGKLSYLESQLLLISQCTQEKLFKECARNLLNEAFKQTPRKYSFNEMKKILRDCSPDIKFSNNQTASKYLLKEFKIKLDIRKKENTKRLQVEIDGKNAIELKMNYEDVANYIIENPGFYALRSKMASGKSEVVKQLLNKATSDKKVLLMTSTVTLVNSLCSDDRNYKTALANKTINEQNGLAVCLYSALLTPSFKAFREASNIAIFEEYESCRDALLADIIGSNGTLEEKTKGQSAFNNLLNKETVLITDAHLSQQSLDHIVARTGRQAIVIKPISEPKREQKKLTYFANRNNAVQSVRDVIDDNKRALTMSDCKHSGGRSKFESTNIEINKDFDIKSIAVDSSFFAQKDNVKHMQNPTEFVNKYDHVMSTSVWRNGISMFSNFDLVTMICHQTVAPLDVLQWAERDRPNICKGIYINNIPNAPQVSWISIFENELKKGILSIDVDEQRELLAKNTATKDIIDRIKHDNEMRLDYANNVLCMFEILNYDIDFDYSCSSKEMNDRESEATKIEKSDRLSVYKMLDKVRHMNELRRISATEEECRTLNDKRLSYASDVFSAYKIDSETDNEIFEDVFNFDEDGYGRTKIENLALVTFGLSSKYYTSFAKEVIFNKLFDCSNLDKNLDSEFSKENFNKFYDFIMQGEIDFEGTREKALNVFKSLFPNIKFSNATWLVKNLLKKEFGLSIEKAERFTEEEDGSVTKSNPTFKNSKGKFEYLMRVKIKDAGNLLKFFEMVYPNYKEINKIVTLEESQIDLVEANEVVQDFECNQDESMQESYNVVNWNMVLNEAIAEVES
ncbi:MAG: hypothetical protein QMC62_05775 [Alteromonadaceae bacterium]